MGRLKKLRKYTLRLLLALLALFLLFSLLIQLPPVQSFLTNRLTGYLSNKLQTEVRIASVRLRLPKSLVLTGVYLEDQQKDTLLNVSELALNFRLNKLFRKRIQLDQFTLDGGTLHLYTNEEGFNNYAFIPESFGGSTDTTIETIEEEPSSWIFTFDQANIALQNIQMEYVDAPGEVELGLDLESFDIAIRSIDLQNNNYQIESIELAGSTIDFSSGSVDTSSSTATTPGNYKIEIGKIGLERIDLKAQMANQQIAVGLGTLSSHQLDLSILEENIDLTLPAFSISNGQLQYDDRSVEAVPSGFDPAHVDFQGINFKIADIGYQDEALSADLQYFSGRDQKGFVLTDLQTQIYYSPDSIHISDFDLLAGRSMLKSKENYIRFGEGGMDSALETWQIFSNWDVQQLNTADITYFYPAAKAFPFFQGERVIKSQGQLSGSLKDLNIEKMVIQDRDLSIDLAGRIAHPTDPEKANLDLQIHRLGSTRQGILDWMPEGTLPEYIQLSDRHFLKGSIRGGVKQMQLRLQGETRRGPVPIVSHIASNIKLENATEPDRLRFDVQLDSFYMTRPDLLAYLPPDLLPETVDLPESISLHGTASGLLSDFTTDLHLETYREGATTSYKLAGQIDSLTVADQPTVGLTFAVEGLNRKELNALLPDELIAEPLQVPDLANMIGKVQGSMDSLNTIIEFVADVAKGQLTGQLIGQENYGFNISLSSLQPDLFFTTGYLDSLLGFFFAPLNVKFKGAGSGFDKSVETWSDLQLNIYREGSVIDSGLVLKVDLVKQLLKAELITLDAGLNMAGDLRVDYSSAIMLSNLSFQLEELDLQQLKIAGKPFRLSGAVESDFRGASPDTLMGQVLAKNWSIDYDSTQQVIDSLWLTTTMDNGKNEFNITSDLLNARLDGAFQFPRVFAALQQQVLHYFDEEAPDSLVGQTTDQFDFEMELLRPEVFTMGIIPGLQELTPGKLSFQYDNRQAKMEMNLDIPHLKWQDIYLDTLILDASADADAFRYQLALRNVDLQQVARVPATRWEGSFANNQLTAQFFALDEKEQDRFVLKTYLQLLGGANYRFKLDPRQLLDYQWWEVSRENELVIQEDIISVQDWRLYRKKEVIELKELGRDRLQVLFQQFNLDLLANVLDQEDPYIGGVINGDITFINPLQQPKVITNLTIDSLLFFDAALGNLVVNSQLDQQEVAAVATLIGEGNDLKLAGKYELLKEAGGMDFQLDFNQINLASLEPLTFGYLENLHGMLKGGLHIGGDPENPIIRGGIHFDSTAFDVGLLNTRLRLGNQPIVFDDLGIAFQELELFDAQNKRGVLKGRLLTENYQTFDLATDLKADNFEVLNTSSTDNDLYYGKLVVDATAQIRGNLYEPDIEIFAEPKRGSTLTYVYRAGTPQVDSHEGIVEFVHPNETEDSMAVAQQLIEGSEELNMKVTVKMEITENLSFKTITNPLTNDYFEGKAKGNMNFTQFPDGRMELTGNVEMVEGRYFFTYQEVVRRAFTVESGSTIRWLGDPLKPELNLKVLYEVETSPFPLLASVTENVEDINANRKETFRVELALSGTPTKTEISTSILYPEITGNSNNAEIQNCIQRINRDPSQQNTQAFALILFNGFIGGRANEGGFNVADLELESNIGNLVTQQLNNLANRYIKFVELDIDLENYEKNGKDSKDGKADFRVSLRKQFLNDRLSISLDGVASAQTDLQAANTTYFLDNLTLEYDLTPDGRFRVKVYNRRDYDDIIGGNSLKVGGALVFSKDFNEFRISGKKK